MIEVASSELPEDDLRAAFEFAHSQVSLSRGGVGCVRRGSRLPVRDRLCSWVALLAGKMSLDSS